MQVTGKSFAPFWMTPGNPNRGFAKSRIRFINTRHEQIAAPGDRIAIWTANLKPRDLHVFLAVAEKGNMAKAAEQLAISRPVVSKTIAELEHTLGVRLLDRTPKGVEPTLYGRALLKRSLAVFDELRQSVSDIEFLANPSAGELRVGFAEVPAAGLVPAAIDRLTRRYPRMRVRTEQGGIGTLLDFLRDRRCEVVVARLLSPEPDMNFEIIRRLRSATVGGAPA